jgi:hypothetical protein
VAVRSRIVAGTVFVEHDFLIMSVELAPGIAIASLPYQSIWTPPPGSASTAHLFHSLEQCSTSIVALERGCQAKNSWGEGQDCART